MIIGLLLKNEKSSLPAVCFIFFLTAHFHTTFFDRFHGRKRIEFGLETIFLLDNNIGFCFEYRVCCKNLGFFSNKESFLYLDKRWLVLQNCQKRPIFCNRPCSLVFGDIVGTTLSSKSN